MKRDAEVLIGRYIELAKLHGAASSEFDYKKANRLHSRVMRVYRELQALGFEARSEFLKLLDHPDMSVRCWAASQSLEFAPERAEPVLRKIAAEGPLPLNLSAEATLMRWRSSSP
jgi:hypothetical protein